MSASSRIKALIDDGALNFGRSPFSASICYFHDLFQRALWESASELIMGGLSLAIGAAGTWIFAWDHRWAAWLSLLIVGFGILFLSTSVPFVVGRWRALNYTSFLALHQHDRALAGLCDALKNGRSILLYLRDFKDEETDELYFKFENQLISIIGESQILIAISNPVADPTLKISPIPRLLVPNARWREVVDYLIERSTRIVIAAEKVRTGLDYEIDTIKQKDAANKTIFVNMSLNEEETPPPRHVEFRWHVSVREFWESVFQSDIIKWLGDLALVTYCREEKTTAPKMRYQSITLRFLWARLSLLGARSFIPRTKFGFYRRWLGAFDQFDPLEKVRSQVLAEERQDAKRYHVVLPLRIIIKVNEGSDPAAEAWNQRVTLQQRMETAVFVMSRRSAWIPIRKALRRTC